MSGRWAGSRHNERLGISGWQRQRDNHRILERDRHTCRQCGERATEVDHVTPLADGGRDIDSNKQALCEPCHTNKTQAEAAQARARRSRVRAQPRHPGLKGGG
jgi:5-methylcytosine-specific restriction enzyme A